MKKLLLSFTFLCAASAAQAQCIAVGGVNSVPQTGVTCASESNINAYAATTAAAGLAVAATATDVVCLQASASRVVRVQRVTVTGTITGTAGVNQLVLNLNHSLDTGGTSTTVAGQAVDPGDVPQTPTSAGVLHYTANPTINDSTPTRIWTNNILFSTGTVNPGIWDWERPVTQYSEAPTLRPSATGTAASQICVNFSGGTIAAGTTIYATFFWTEAPQ